MNVKATTSAAPAKPKKHQKPYPDFPLTPHPNGSWCKKVRGKLHYFGRIEGDEQGLAALELWKEQEDDLRNGRTPRGGSDELTLKSLGDQFCAAKERQKDAGEITGRQFKELHRDFGLVVNAFGKNRLVKDLAADDFERLRASLSERFAPVTLKNTIQRIRQVFKWARDNGRIDFDIRYGTSFNKPSAAVLRRARAEKGERLFEATELRQLIALARPSLRAMLLLGVNCGFENSSCAKLEFRHLDLDGGWLNFPRPKTGIARRCKLWPKTVKALRAAIAKRTAPSDPAHSDRVFITKRGLSWDKGGMASPISHQFRYLLDDLEIHRPGLSFYTLRHQFETIAGGSRDQVAVNLVMGHADASMAAVYRERIEDERLIAVADYVHGWLYPPAVKKAKKPAKPTTKRRLPARESEPETDRPRLRLVSA
jgi:integrase